MEEKVDSSCIAACPKCGQIRELGWFVVAKDKLKCPIESCQHRAPLEKFLMIRPQK